MLKHYWRLRELMAKYGLTQSNIASISGISEVSISKKLNSGQEFKITPACKILNYFRDRGEKVDFEELFCTNTIDKGNGFLYASGD